MKRLRSTVVAVITVGLLTGSAVGVAGRDQDPGVAVVRGHFVERSLTSHDLDLPLSGMLQRSRDWDDTGRLVMSDERMSGDITMTYSIDRWASDQVAEGDVALFWGDVRIENDGGAWVGTHVAADGQARDRVFVQKVMQLTGTGGYEGSSAILYWTSDPLARQLPDSVDGMIFPGDLPPER